MELNTNPSNPNTLLGTDSIDIINIESPLHEMSGVDGAFTSYVDQSLNEIVFVDASVENHENLIGGVASDAKIILLDSGRDGILQISQRLEEFDDVKAVHVVSHGSAGLIQLGSTELSQNNLSQYTDDLIGWGQSLNEDADLLFYGCNVGEGTEGQAFLNDVSILTGADVAGSDDLTGNVVYGGDNWLLEYSTGDIEAETLRGNSSFTDVLGTVSLSDDGKLTFNEGIGIKIANSLSLSVIDGGASLLIKEDDNSLTAGSNATQVSFNQVKVGLSAIKDVEFKLGFGTDSLSFDNEISFANGQLSSFIIEGEENTLPGVDLVIGDLVGDSVTFTDNLYLGGANLNVSAENITVKDGVTISTRQVADREDHLSANSTGKSGELYFIGINPINITAGLGNIQSVRKIEIGNKAKLLSHVEKDSSYAAADVWLNARYFSNADIDNLFTVTSPEDWAAKTAKITIGENATLKGNNIVITAQAEDKNFSELIGTKSQSNNFVITPLKKRLAEEIALPVKFLVRKSDALINVNTGAKLTGLAGVSVEAIATTNSTGIAKGSVASIGYAHAEASAKVNIKTEVEIEAGEAVRIGSEGDAKASITTKTEGTKSSSAGLSLAVDYANITSHTIVEQGATITAGKNVNIIALGNKETEAEAESKTSKSGKLSFGFGINISDTDIKTDVDGTIIANQNPGAIVKFELDPLKQVTYEFNPTNTKDNIVNTTDNTINLSDFSKTDPKDRDKFTHSLRTGDKIKYTTQAGSNIGGLENDKEYYIVIDPNNSNLIRLTNSRTDAFAIENALKTSENSDDGVITSKSVDLSSIGSLSNTNFAANSAVDGDKDTITFNTTNQFKIGQPVIYKKDTGNVIPGLNDGQVYYVITYSNTDSQQTIQLAEKASEARQGKAIDISNATGNHSFSPLHQLTAKITDTETDSIDLAKVFGITNPKVTPHALATGDEVNYTNRRGDSIGGAGLGSVVSDVLSNSNTGLVDEKDYFIVTDPNNPNIIRLASSEIKALEAYSKLEDDANADLDDLVINFADNGGDVAGVNSKTFDPTKIGIVDDTQNKIILDNAAREGNLFGSTFEIGQAVVYSSGGGKPIGGLEDGKTYYVVTATDQNNLDGDNRFVGEQVIQLADTENKSYAGVFLDIDPSQATGTEHRFTATHVIDSWLVAGIGVLARLDTTNTSVAESNMNGGDKVDDPDATFDVLDKAKKIFTKLVNDPKNGNYGDKSSAGGNNSGKSSLAVAGALGFAYVNNDVIANVGSNAILKSKEDLEVIVTIEHEVKLNADSDVANIADNSGSAAVIVGIYNNNADAIVNSNAQLDAYKASYIGADVRYPYLTRPDEFVPADLGEFIDLVKTDGYDAVNDYLDGTLGLKSKLLNTWARSTASADNIGVSGSVNLLTFNNNVNAIIKENAKINQDLAWRKESEDQSVTVEAVNYMQMLNLTGVFQFALPSLELGLAKGAASKGDKKLLGSDGKTGFGGAFFLMFLNNNTKAIVEDGVSIYSGAAGGFNMKAEEAIMNFNFTQAGSKAESYGIGGTFAYVNQNSNTLAQLSGGTRVEGRSATIYAGSLESHINWAGGVAVGKNLGFGITVAINDIDRSTNAIIGNYDPSIEDKNQAIPVENTEISVTDAVTVNALSDGWLGAFSVAAAAATESTPKDDEVDGKSLNILFGDEPAEPSSKLGFSGDVSYNQVDDKVRAIVWDAGLLEASTIALSALNETDLYSVAGAVAFAKGGQNKNSFGLAGAASWNEILGEAKAYIKGQGVNKKLKLNADQLTLDAKQKGEIFAITAGGSGAFATGSGNNVSLAGSFSYNEIENTTESYLDGVNTTLFNSAKSVLNITPQSAIANNTINLDKSHGWLTGEKVIYDNGGDSQNITGLVSGKAYYVITDNDNPNSFKLASTEANAKNNIALSINGAGITGTSHSFTANNPLPIGFESDQIEVDETKENTITFSKNHGWAKDTAVIYDNGGGKSIGGLTHNNTYYVVTDNRDGKILKLATNSNGTGIVNLDPSVAEGEGHRFYKASTPSSTQIIDLEAEHGWNNGDIVTYINDNGTAIDGLEDGEQYYVIVVDSTKIKLAKTSGGTAINLNYRTAKGDKHSIYKFANDGFGFQSFTFDPVEDNAFNLSQVEVKENFALDNPHDFSTGQAVVYDNGDGTSIGGLTNGKTYYVIVDEDPNTFRLANSEFEAKLGFAIGLDPTDPTDPTKMAGDNHQFFLNSSVISAKDESKIFAVAGGATISLGGQKGGGFGFGFAWNDIDNTTKALVQNSTLTHDDSLQVIASNNSDIQTISASIGISKAQQSAGTIAGTASVNFIDNVTEAAIINTNNGTVDNASGLVRVKALDQATIQSLSGAVSVAISSQTSLGFGAAVAYNKIGTQSGHSTKAYISGSSIYVENLDVTANSNQLIKSLSASAAAAKSGKAAISAAGAVSINTIGDTQTAAYISGSPNIVVDQGINIKAKNEAKIQSFAGQVAVSFGSKGGGAIGGAIAVNRIDKTSDSNNEIGVYAYIDSSKVTSNSDRFDINIKAVSTSKIETISAGVQIGGGAKFGGVLGGSISINNIISTVSSYIANNADVTATKQNINLKTDDTTNIRAIAGQAAIAGGKGAAALGLAWADNDVDNKIKSYIDKSKVATSSGSIDVNANSTAKIETLSAGAQIAGGKGSGALGGSQSSNTITNTISSYISNGAEVTANQNLDIKAKDESTIRSIAGQVAIAGGKGAAGVGVAWATNRVKNQVNSYINQKSQVTTNIGSININANSNADIQTISAGIQVAGGALAGAAGGSVSSNIVENKIKSYIDKDADVTVNQNLDIKAKDTSNIIAIAGQAAIAGGKAAGAVGVVWADNDIKNLVESYIDFSKVRTNIGSINLNANSISTIKTLSAGAQIAGGAVGIAAGGSTSINTVENTVSSYIKNNSNVTAEQKINLKTNDNSTIRALAGQVAIAVGKGSGTIGVALAENDIENNIKSYIESSTVKANNDSIDINAVSTAKIETLSAVASGSGGKFSGSVAVPISHNQIKNSISAHIKNSANISAKQDIEVKATDNSTIKSLSGGAALAFSIGGGVGVAYSYNNIENDTLAYTSNSTLNSTTGSILVSADSNGTIKTIAAAMGGSGIAGVAGSIAINEMDNETYAYVSGGSLTADGSVGIFSQSRNQVKTWGGAVGIGGAGGVGGTVAVNNIDNITKAYVTNNGNLKAKGQVSIELPKEKFTGSPSSINGVSIIAVNNEEVEVKVGTVTLGGKAGLSGTVVVNSIENTTQAYVNGGTINNDLTEANNDQSVLVKAFSDTNLNVLAGGLAIGSKAGIGISLDVSSIKNTTTAYIGNETTVKAKKDITVEAIGKKTLESNVVAGGGGGVAGLAGAISVINIGSAMSDDGSKAASKGSGVVSDQINEINQYSNKITIDTSIISEFAKDAVVNHATQAYIGTNANLQAGGDISVKADETTKLHTLAGVVGIGLALGAGGAVGVVNVNHNAQAFVGAGATLSARGDINVEATGNIGSNKDVDPNKLILSGEMVETYAGTAGTVGLGAAVSYLEVNNNVQAYIASSSNNQTQITQAQNVNVLATANSNLSVKGAGASIGLVAVAGAVIGRVSEGGTVKAYLGDSIQIGQGNGSVESLSVKAIGNGSATAKTQSAAGGLLASGNGSDARVTINPNITAYIGNSSNIQVNDDVEVISDVTVDGDANAKGFNIGSKTAGASIATVNAEPKIETYVSANAVINAKNITVESRLGEPIKVPDTSFNPSNAVKTNNNTITFKENHGLDTGDSLVYSNGGGTDIGGLKNGSSYKAIKVDDKTVKLGTEFDAAEVDVKFNTIKFSGNHGFKDGDEVIYQAKGGNAIGGLGSGNTYYVQVVDSNTIKLTDDDGSSDSSNIQGANLEKIDTTGIDTTISIENHGFQNNDVINYQRRSAQFNIVKEISDDAKDKNNIFNLDNDIKSQDIIKSANHGFETNDKVIYSTTGTELGGLENGKEYYIIKVKNNQFKLSATKNGKAIDFTSAEVDTSHKITAVGLKIQEVEKFDFTYIDDSEDTNTITKNSHGFTDGQEVVYQTNGTALEKLTVGTTYYIKKVDNNKFQLSATKNGAAIDFGANNDNHQLIINKGFQELEEGVSYYVVREDENNFKLSTTKGGKTLTLSKEHLSGKGFNHLFTKDDAIDLTSASTGKHNFHIDLTSKGSGDKHILSAGVSATVPSQGDNKFSVYAQASAGALVGSNATTANLNITPTINTYVGEKALITATGNVSITSLSSIEATGTSDSKIGSLIAVGSSKINTDIKNNNNTYIGSGVQIKADGNVDITGQSDQTLNISGYGGAGSLITFADADAHATITHNTITKINDGANIISNDTLTVRSSSNTNGNVKVKADGVGLYADADADSSITFKGKNDTTVNGRLEARTLNVEAIVDTLKVESRSESYGAGAIGNIDAKAKVDLTDSYAKVNLGSRGYIKGDYVTLDARYKTVQSNAIALADCDGLGGDTDTVAENIMPIEAEVVTDANSTLEVYKLDVKSDFESFNRTTTADSDKAWSITIWNPIGDDFEITMDFGDEKPKETYSPTPIIDFNAKVKLVTRDVNPVLSIDENGKIVRKSDNVTTSEITSTSTDIIVNDIGNAKVGEVNFIIPSRSDETRSKGKFTDKGEYIIINPAYDTVHIENYSNKNLIVNDIQVIGSGEKPPINYDKVNVNTEITATSNPEQQNSLPVNPTIVKIENWGSSDLILQGVIDNPHDRTILYSKGDILSKGSQKIITRDLTATAMGSIGTNEKRIIAQLNQGYTPVTADVPSSDIYLKTEADSVFLDLTTKQLNSNSVTVNVEKMEAATGEVNLSIRQTKNQSNVAVSALYDFTKIIAGTNIVINAQTSSSNIKGNTDLGTGLLDVVTGGYINLTEVAGAINLKQATSHQEYIHLSVAETSSVGENLLLVDNAVVKAAKDVTFLVGDDFQINPTATIAADGKVVIRSDANDQDPNGTLVNIFGLIEANSMEIYGNNDDDIFNIRRLDTNTTLWAKAGKDTINVGSRQPDTGGNVNNITKSLTIHGEDNVDGAGDILNVDDSGDNTDNSGTLTDKSITGLGMGAGIFYNTIEQLNIDLGSGNDNFITLNNGTITNLNTGAGNDRVQIGPTLDENGVPEDEILDGVLTSGSEILGTSHLMTVRAGAGEDAFEVNRNTAELKLYGEADNDTVTVNTAIARRRHLNNALVDVIGGEGINQAFINGSEIADEMVVRGDSVEIVDSHLINLAKIAFLDIKGKKGQDIFHIDTNIDSSGSVLATSDMQNLEVDGGDSDDTINLYGMRSTTDIKLYGGSQDDTFNIGSESGATVNKISGAVEIFGDRPNTRRTNQDSDTLNINDNQDTAKNTGVLTDDEITGLGLGKEGIVYKGLETVNINLGTGDDNFTVKSTHTGATNINANDGKDKIQITAIAGDTTVKAGDGRDTVNAGIGGTVDNIQASLVIHGEGDTRDKDVLNIDDSGDSDDNSGVLTENSLTGLDMKVGIFYHTFEYLNLALGSGSDDLIILDNAAITTIDAGNGDNSFRIGAVLDENGTPQSETVNGELKPGEEIAGISQEMTINAGSGNNFFQVNRNIADLNLNGNTGADTFEVNITAVSGSNELVNIDAGTGADVATFNGSSSSEQFEINSSSVEVVNKRLTNLTGVETLKVNGRGGSESFNIDTTVDKDGESVQTSDITNIEISGNSGNDQFELQATLSTISTTLQGNEGSDIFNVGNTSNKVDSILGAVSIFGDESADTFNFNNQGDRKDNRGSFSRNEITGFGLGASIIYNSLEDIQINLGSGDDTFTIEGTNTGKTVVNTNDGEDKVDIKSVSGQTTVNTGDDEDVITVDRFNSSGSAVLEINSSDGDDSIDASAAIIGMTINGNDGDDTILGGAGNDTIGGGADDDRIDAGAGDDLIDGDSNFIDNRFRTESNRNQGDDTIWGGAGKDEINGRGGDDYLIGGSAIADTPNGKDTIIAGWGNDFEANGNANIDPLTGAIVQINDDSQTNSGSSTGQQQQNGNTGTTPTTQPSQNTPTTTQPTQNTPVSRFTPIRISPIRVSIPSIRPIGTISNNQPTQNNPTNQETPTTQPTQNNPTTQETPTTQNTTTNQPTQNTPVSRFTPIRISPIRISIPSIRPIRTVFNNQPSPNTTTTQDNQVNDNSTNN